MERLKLSHWLAALVFAVLIFTLWQSFSQEGVHDLSGNYREVALYRNENNTGPIVRIYAVTTADTLWQEMKTYGELMPYTKYGTTEVYFFSSANPYPEQVYSGEQHFDARFRSYCLARYEKSNMGQVTFTRYPFRE